MEFCGMKREIDRKCLNHARVHANAQSFDRCGPRAKSNTGSPRFTDFPSLCACSESSLTNLIGSGINLLCLQSHSKTECRWTMPEVAILGADQKERGLWGRECMASRDKVDGDTFHKGIQYQPEKLGKSKFGFERTAVSNFNRPKTRD